MAEIVADQRAALAGRDPADGVAVVTGAGARITLRLGHLAVKDGVGTTRRSRRFPRVATPASRLSRLVIEAGSGFVTLDALGWCRAVGVVVVGLDRDGEPAWATLPDGPRDARLTRALALAGSAGDAGGDDPTGLAIVRMLLRAKMAGQRHVASKVLGRPAAADTVAALIEGLARVRTVDEARQLEASAAAVYFDAWVDHPAAVPVFTRRDASRVPASWASYPGRRSVLGAGRSNRRATHPTNTILNYLFTLARIEAGVALNRLGLDPSLGVLHADTARRDSLACDLAEVARPAVEAYVIELFRTRVFRRTDFCEGTEGEVRLGMSLRAELAGTMSRWAHEVAPHAEAVRNLLASAVRDGGAASSGIVETAPLTGTRRKAAANRVVARRAEAAVAAGRKASMAAIRREQRPSQPSLWRCPDCGGSVMNPRHVRCDACISSDPRQAPEVRGRRGAAIAARKRTLRAWEEANPGASYDPEWFRRDILPSLAGVKLSDIMAAIGCSKASASDIRRGKRTPHVSTWRALGELVGVDGLAHDDPDHRRSREPSASSI